MVKTTELERLYAATTYRVYLPGGGCDLRIGQHSEFLAGWMKEHGVQCFALITAHNPGSSRCDGQVNAEQQSRLECELLEGNYEPYAAENIPDGGDWPIEESCFVPDLLPADACALAADYRQNAIVCGNADGLAQLVWVEEN